MSTSIHQHFLREKVEQLSRLTRKKQLDQIFEWVKTDHISCAVFRDLIAVHETFDLQTMRRKLENHEERNG